MLAKLKRVHLKNCSAVPMVDTGVNGTFEYRNNISYYNYTGETLLVSAGTGEDILLNPKADNINNGFLIIQQRVSYNRETINLMLDRFRKGYYIGTPLHEAIERTWSKNPIVDIPTSMNSLTMEYRVHICDIRLNGEVLHIPSLNITVSVYGHNSDGQVNPNSQLGEMLTVGNDMVDVEGGDTESDYNFRVWIIDNEGKIHARYFNMNGKVHKVTGRKFKDVSDGIYVLRTNSVHHDSAVTTPNIEFYPVNSEVVDADEINFYKTYAEADICVKNKEKAEALRKSAELKANLKLAEEKAKAAEQARLEQMEEARREAKRKEEEHEIKMRKLMEEAKIKEELRDREHELSMKQLKVKMESEERKSWTDIGKSILNLAVAVVPVVALFLAKSKTPSTLNRFGFI